MVSEPHVRHSSTLKTDYMLLPHFLYVTDFFVHVKMFLLVLWQLNFFKSLWWKTLQNVFWKSKQTTPATCLLSVWCLLTPSMNLTRFVWHDCPLRNHADSSPIYKAMCLLNFIFRKHSTSLRGKGLLICRSVKEPRRLRRDRA